MLLGFAYVSKVTPLDKCTVIILAMTFRLNMEFIFVIPQFCFTVTYRLVLVTNITFKFIGHIIMLF